MNKYAQFNKSGCRDMTAYFALRNIEREQMQASRLHEPGILPQNAPCEKQAWQFR